MLPVLTFLLLLLPNRYDCGKNEKFSLKYIWEDVNYTWPSIDAYQNALKSKKYIPGNTEIEGMKIYKDYIYFGIPLHKPGIPVTLGRGNKIGWKSGIVTPYPSWEENVDVKNCSTFQSVQGFEVDTKGILWVIDGERKNNQTRCPCKLVLLDLNQNGKIVHTHIFPDQICLRDGGFLNDIMIDETDGTYAYITDASFIDPGLIIFSKKTNTSWKIRHASMFPNINATDYLVDGKLITALDPIDGIALSPKIYPNTDCDDKMVYYSAYTSFELYGISTAVLKNDSLCRSDQWRRFVLYIGEKQSQGDGMIFNEKGELYYSLVPLFSVGLWNSSKSFKTARIIDKNQNLIKNPNSFGFDGTDLYLLGYRRILQLNTNAGSYIKN